MSAWEADGASTVTVKISGKDDTEMNISEVNAQALKRLADGANIGKFYVFVNDDVVDSPEDFPSLSAGDVIVVRPYDKQG